MSGGHFDYKQYGIKEAADQIMLEAVRNEFCFSKETQDKFLLAAHRLEVASIYLNRIDWLLSGDDGEETFHERLAEDLKELEGK